VLSKASLLLTKNKNSQGVPLKAQGGRFTPTFKFHTNQFNKVSRIGLTPKRVLVSTNHARLRGFIHFLSGFQTIPTASNTMPTMGIAASGAEKPFRTSRIAPNAVRIHPIKMSLNFILSVFSTPSPLRLFLRRQLLPFCQYFLPSENSCTYKEQSNVNR
jgi:hypothetical protein